MAALAPLARRRLVIGAIESGAFSFAFGVLVQFWSQYVTWAADCARLGTLAGLATMLTLVVLTTAETAGGFVGAARLERLGRRKRFVSTAGLATHGAWLVFGLAMPLVPPGWLLGLTFGLVAWRGFFDGLLICPTLDLAARVVPADERPRYFSVRAAAAALGLPAGGGCASLVFQLLPDHPSACWPILFAAAGAAACSSDLARLGYPEAETAVSRERLARRMHHDLAEYWRVVLRDGRFLRLCAAGAAAGLTVSFAPYLVGLFGKLRLELADREYSRLALLGQLSPAVMLVALPRLVSALGWRRTYAVLIAQFAVAFGLLAAATWRGASDGGLALLLVAGAFVLMGLGKVWSFAEANVLYAIVGEEKRPSYLVVGRTVANVIAVAVLLVTAGLGRGGELPYAAIFAAMAAAMLAASGWIIWGLRGAGDTANARLGTRDT